MKVGDLVKITRAPSGTPLRDRLARLIGFYPAGAEGKDAEASWEVQLLSGHKRIYLAQDLEIIE
jgi:hypothetical protein